MRRMFIAFDMFPSEETKSTYSIIRQKLQAVKINWVPDHQFHITLKFLGELSEEIVPDIIAVMDSVIPGLPSFEVWLKGAGIFGNVRDPKVIWLGCCSGNVPNILKDKLEKGLEKLGFPIEKRPFSPHLTLGRIKQSGQIDQLAGIIHDYKERLFQKQEIRNILLYESQLTPAGSVYTTVHQSFLDAAKVDRFQS